MQQPNATGQTLTRRLCARNTGVGADGIEFFAWTGSKSGRVRLHNADGSIAEISGNGTRCVAAWMSSMIGAKAGDELRIETDAGLRICRINNVPQIAATRLKSRQAWEFPVPPASL